MEGASAEEPYPVNLLLILTDRIQAHKAMRCEIDLVFSTYPDAA